MANVYGAMVKMFGFLLSLVGGVENRKALVVVLERRLLGMLAKADAAAGRRAAEDVAPLPPAA